MNILFITSSRIGDAVLSSGLLNHIEQNHPKASVTIACGPLAVSLFEGYPLLDRMIPIKKQKYHGHWVKLWKEVVGQKWNMVIDLRNSLVSRMIRAEQRFIFGPHIDQTQHKVEQNAAVMRLRDVPAPKLWLTQEQQDEAAKLIPDGKAVLGVGPTANWMGKTWPADRYIELVKKLTDKGGVLSGYRVAVFGAPGEEDIAQLVLDSVPKTRRLNLIAKGSPGLAAACLSRCDAYIGNDSGLMHCAAAAGIPTFGLFGPSKDQVYAPYGPHAAFIRTPQSMDELIDYDGYDPKTCGSLMESLSTEDVLEVFSEFIQNKIEKAA